MIGERLNSLANIEYKKDFKKLSKSQVFETLMAFTKEEIEKRKRLQEIESSTMYQLSFS